MLGPLRQEHIARVADLHCRTLVGLLSALGPAATAAFYKGYLASPHCVAFVDEEQGVVRGFVLGSGDPERMRRDALRANGRRIVGRIVLSVAFRPRVLGCLIDAVTGLRGSRFDARTAELTYIAVREDARGSGVGSGLLAAFHSALGGQGVHRYELSVEAGNTAAVAFYESRGFHRTATYRQFDTTYRRYARELPPAVAAEER